MKEEKERSQSREKKAPYPPQTQNHVFFFLFD
jgi:hypothetical protein